MTVIDRTTTPQPSDLVRSVAFDLYRDIHKGIRSELFAVTEEAGRADSSDRGDRAALADHLGSVVDLLVSHAEHEDLGIQPVLEQHLPELAEAVEADHLRLDARLATVAALAEEAVDGTAAGARGAVHQIYVELASFTSSYLVHQDLEERVIMPELDRILPFEELVAIHERIVGSIPPEEMARSLAVMLPAMNVDDRTDLLGGMRAGAPAEVFTGIWSLAGSILTPADHAALATRLGM